MVAEGMTSGVAEGAEDLKHFNLAFFGIHSAPADLHFFSYHRFKMERRANKKKLSRNLLDMKVSV